MTGEQPACYGIAYSQQFVPSAGCSSMVAGSNNPCEREAMGRCPDDLGCDGCCNPCREGSQPCDNEGCITDNVHEPCTADDCTESPCEELCYTMPRLQSPYNGWIDPQVAQVAGSLVAIQHNPSHHYNTGVAAANSHPSLDSFRNSGSSTTFESTFTPSGADYNNGLISVEMTPASSSVQTPTSADDAYSGFMSPPTKKVKQSPTATSMSNGFQSLDLSPDHFGFTSDPSIDPTQDLSWLCRWDTCNQRFEGNDLLSQHIHYEHLDGQLQLVCPIAECHQPTGPEPGLHLMNTHGLDVSQGHCIWNGCQTDLHQLDQNQRHLHMDTVHAQPLNGQYTCNWEDCGVTATELSDFMSHLTNQHHMDINSSLTTSTAQATFTASQYQPKTNTFATPVEDRTEKDDSQEDMRISPHRSGRPSTGPITEATRCQWGACGQVFHTSDDLQDHLSAVHLKATVKKDGGYYCHWAGCDRCDKEAKKEPFAQKGKLERHMLTHSGCMTYSNLLTAVYTDRTQSNQLLVRFAVCPVQLLKRWRSTCGHTPRRNLTSAHFQAVQKHSPNPALSVSLFVLLRCSSCQVTNRITAVHIRTHTKEKPLKCNICGAAFSESSNLSKHKKTHDKSGTLPCKQPGCGKTFARIDQLKRHVKKMHERGSSGAAVLPVGCKVEKVGNR